MLTEIGKELRRMRIESGEKLASMAHRLAISSSFLSAVETGRKLPPEGFEEKVVGSYGLSADSAERLRTAAIRSRDSFTITAERNEAKDTAAMFAREVGSLSLDQLEDIQRILRGKNDDGA